MVESLILFLYEGVVPAGITVDGILKTYCYFILALFFSTLIAMRVFLLHAKRRRWFAFRLCSFSVVVLITNLVVLWAYWAVGIDGLDMLLLECLILLESSLFLLGCYKTDSLLISLLCGYALQNFISNLLRLSVQEFLLEKSTFIFFFVEILLYGAVYLAVGLWFKQFRRKYDARPAIDIGILIAGAITAFAIVVEVFANALEDQSYLLYLFEKVLAMLCDISVILLLINILKEASVKKDKMSLETYIRKKSAEMDRFKEVAELLNIRIHDLKHSLIGGGQKDSTLQEIDLYDRQIATGNEMINLILTEQNLYCKRDGIALSCMVNGASLSFMERDDMCALFCNALENAREAVSKIQETEKRLINFTGRTEGGLYVIEIDNYCIEVPKEVNGLPITDKMNKKSHGWGMKSIRLVVEKYGGQMRWSVKDNIFHLVIVLPLVR